MTQPDLPLSPTPPPPSPATTPSPSEVKEFLAPPEKFDVSLDPGGRTALHLAIVHSHPNVVSVLLDYKGMHSLSLTRIAVRESSGGTRPEHTSSDLIQRYMELARDCMVCMHVATYDCYPSLIAMKTRSSRSGCQKGR